jgi:hypothetical protein
MKTASKNIHARSMPSPLEMETASVKRLQLQEAYRARLVRDDERTRTKRKRALEQVLLDSTQEETVLATHPQHTPYFAVPPYHHSPMALSSVQAPPLPLQTSSFLNAGITVPSATAATFPIQQQQPQHCCSAVPICSPTHDVLLTTVLGHLARHNNAMSSSENNHPLGQVLLHHHIAQPSPSPPFFDGQSLLCAFAPPTTAVAGGDPKAHVEAATLAAIYYSLGHR